MRNKDVLINVCITRFLCTLNLSGVVIIEIRICHNYYDNSSPARLPMEIISSFGALFYFTR